MVNVKNIVLGIGIVVVFALVLWQGIEAFYGAPEYEDYCPSETFVPADVQTEAQCVDAGGKWSSYGSDIRAKPVAVLDNNSTVTVTGYCDLYFSCREEYENAQDSYSWIVFVISIIVAIGVFVLGYGLLSVEPVGSALMGSGVWAIFYGSVINWRNFSSIWRFLLLFIALVLLIWIALRINKGVGKK